MRPANHRYSTSRDGQKMAREEYCVTANGHVHHGSKLFLAEEGEHRAISLSTVNDRTASYLRYDDVAVKAEHEWSTTVRADDGNAIQLVVHRVEPAPTHLWLLQCGEGGESRSKVLRAAPGSTLPIDFTSFFPETIPVRCMKPVFQVVMEDGYVATSPQDGRWKNAIVLVKRLEVPTANQASGTKVTMQ